MDGLELFKQAKIKSGHLAVIYGADFNFSSDNFSFAYGHGLFGYTIRAYADRVVVCAGRDHTPVASMKSKPAKLKERLALVLGELANQWI